MCFSSVITKSFKVRVLAKCASLDEDASYSIVILLRKQEDRDFLDLVYYGFSSVLLHW